MDFVKLLSGQTFYIVNKKSGTVLDLSGSDKTSIIGWSLNKGDNQKVSFIVTS